MDVHRSVLFEENAKKLYTYAKYEIAVETGERKRRSKRSDILTTMHPRNRLW